MQPSGSQSGGPDTAPDPVRTAVAQDANTVRYRRDLRRSPEVLENMSKAELILVNTAVRACPTKDAASMDSTQLILRIRACLEAHERRDAVQLRLVRRHESTRDSLLFAPEGPFYDPHAKSSCLSQICRYKETVTPSDLLEALAQDLDNSQAHLACAIGTVLPENRETLLGTATRLEEIGNCLKFHKSMVSFTPAPPTSNGPRYITFCGRHSSRRHPLVPRRRPSVLALRAAPDHDPRPASTNHPGTRDPDANQCNQGPDPL